MIDIGVPFKNIKEELYDNVRVILLTHIHSDHINPSTLASVKKLFPNIPIFGNYEVYQTYPDFGINVVNAGFKFKAGQYEFEAFDCEHNALCYGYVWEMDGQTILYATDLTTTKNIPERQYDAIFLESNHDIHKLEAAMYDAKKGYNPYLSGKRHLSTQDAKTFYYTHRRNKDSLFVPLHQSSRFY
jgi:L-ascorbate metabolism protein UlaG (beta-lactamase superfamily)